MKVIERATMPNGTEIILEDWRDKNTSEYPDLYGLSIGAYPVAKNTSPYKWILAGEIFRLEIAYNPFTNYTNDNVKRDFEALKNGVKSLEELSEHFWNGDKDKFYLGMIDNYSD